jgi:N utilization substance protein A
MDVEGVDLAMAVKFGENDVKTVDDLAGLVGDDLRGWFETKNGERVREPGILEEFNLSSDDADMMIMRARVAAGWISEEDLPQPEVEEVDEAEAGEAGDIDLDIENMDLEALEAEAEALGLDFNEVDGELADEEDQAG